MHDFHGDHVIDKKWETELEEAAAIRKTKRSNMDVVRGHRGSWSQDRWRRMTHCEDSLSWNSQKKNTKPCKMKPHGLLVAWLQTFRFK